MAITVQDQHGTYGRKRKADGPPLDKRSARYFVVVNNVWSKGATTRKAAEQIERKMKGDVDRGVSLSGSALTLREFFDGVWWPSVDARQKRGDIAIGTALHYKIIANSYILPTLGTRRLRHLSAADLRALYAGLRDREKPLSARTIQAAHRVASMMLVFALDDGYITKNPALGRDVAPKGRATSVERDAVWDAAQIKTFLEVVGGDRLFALWRLAATTGMRRGELLAMRWSDLELSAGRAHIVRSFVLSPDHKVRYTSPKTARGRRTIDLDAATVKALKSHRKAQAEERLASLGAWPETGDDFDLVFTDEVGRPLFPRTVTMRFAEIIADADLVKIRLHDLRHSVATLMLRAGVPVHVVSEHLGHASPSITMDVYAHVLRDQRTDAAAKLASAIDSS